jgi:hypothetical protein
MNDHYLLSVSLSMEKNDQRKEGKKKRRMRDMSKDNRKKVQNSSNSILKLYKERMRIPRAVKKDN